mgnify:CR=1 FL=1
MDGIIYVSGGMIFPVKIREFYTQKCIYDMTYCEDVTPELDIKTGQWVYWFNSRTFYFWVLSDGVNTYKPQLVLKFAL